MEILESSLSGVPVLRIDGEVDHSTAPALQQSIQKALRAAGMRVLLDLSACPFLDSGGLSVLLSALADLPEDGLLGVIGARPDLLRIFGIVGLLTLPGFRVFSDTEEAVAALQG
jgi:anti-sigma B factor antagonist